MNSALHVGIVGGGIAGLTCALALSKAGYKVSLHERAPALEEVGAGIQLSPNALKPLYALGLSSALNAVASAPRSIDVYDGIGCRPIASVPLGRTAEQRYGAPYHVIHRADLQWILAQACEREANVKIHLGSQIGVIQEDNEGVRVGQDRFDLVVAADGVNSVIRRQLFGVQSNPSGLVAWRTTLPMKLKPEFFARERTCLCVGKNAHLVTYPIASGKELNAVAIMPNGIHPRDGFGRWSDRITAILELGDWLDWPLNSVPSLDSWTKGRIALIGDAAHAMLPFAAQGGAMAIEDAYLLAQSLTNSCNTAVDLSTWEIKRKKRAETVSKLATRNRWIYHLSGPQAVARNLVMQALGPTKLLARQDWVYGYDA
ncbi:MAG: FAD-dependent monooxygenase, partial [Pseudomonadota bacterium]